MPPRTTSADNLIKRVAPDILALLADGVPRRRYVIVAALAHRHPKPDVQRTLARLVVLGRLDQQSGWYSLPAAEVEQG
jgi:hypothetical protein